MILSFLCLPWQDFQWVAQYLSYQKLYIFTNDIWEYQELTRKTEAVNWKIFWEDSAFKNIGEGWVWAMLLEQIGVYFMVSFLQGQACLAGCILSLIMMSGDIWQGKINAICSTAFCCRASYQYQGPSLNYSFINLGICYAHISFAAKARIRRKKLYKILSVWRMLAHTELLYVRVWEYIQQFKVIVYSCIVL